MQKLSHPHPQSQLPHPRPRLNGWWQLGATTAPVPAKIPPRQRQAARANGVSAATALVVREIPSLASAPVIVVRVLKGVTVAVHRAALVPRVVPKHRVWATQPSARNATHWNMHNMRSKNWPCKRMVKP